jgi:hypothetical protein
LVVLRKRRLLKSNFLLLSFGEIANVSLVLDRVYSGFAVAGSSAAQSFPVPSLRLVLNGGASVLLDRGGTRRLEELGERVARRLGAALEKDAALR